MSKIALEPRPGRLTATVFENRHLGIEPTLFFGVEIPLEPFVLEGETQDTAVTLEFIKLPVSDWREIEGREYRFPVNPKDGYIDASVYVGRVHNPADVTSIRFGRMEGGSIPAEFKIQFDFDAEGLGLGRVGARWKVPLSFDTRQMDEAVAEARRARSRRGVPGVDKKAPKSRRIR